MVNNNDIAAWHEEVILGLVLRVVPAFVLPRVALCKTPIRVTSWADSTDSPALQSPVMLRKKRQRTTSALTKAVHDNKIAL